MTDFKKVEKVLKENFLMSYNSMKMDFSIRKIGTKHDVELTEVYRQLNHLGVKIQYHDLKLLLKSEFVEKINPIKDYFDSIENLSDGSTDFVKRLSSFIQTDFPNFENCLRKVLLRTVACSLDVDYFNKHALTLISPDQNIGKTSFLRYLVPPKLNEYYTEYMSFDKDGEIALANNFIIILDELTSFSTSSMNTVKSILSRRDVRVRPAYSERVKNMPRIASFLATTNEADFLTDTTGNVRWIVVEVKSIDFDYDKLINIDFVWAEIYQLYKSKQDGKLTSEEIQIIEKNNSKYLNPNPIIETLASLFEPCNPQEVGAVIMTTTEVQTCIKKIKNRDFKVQGIGRAMRQLGFIRSQKVSSNKYYVHGYWIKHLIDFSKK